MSAHLALTAQPTRSRTSAIHDPEIAALWRQHLRVEPGPTGRIALLRLAGDLDMLTLPLVCAALVTAVDTRPADLVVDLSEVRFCGVRGFALLAAAARMTADSAIGYAVVGVGAHLERSARRIWSDECLVRYPDIAAALAAVHREQLRRCGAPRSPSVGRPIAFPEEI
jgi:anti-anti-sigma factor